MNKPDTCQGCPLAEKGKGFCPDKMTEQPVFLFQGEAPGKNEAEQGEPFVGKAGFVLKEWLIKAVPKLAVALGKKQVSFGNTLRCLPPEVQGRPYPKGAEKEQAEQHCRQYDNWDKVETFVLFGEHAQRLHFKEELEAEDASDRRMGHDVKGIMGRIGRIYEKNGKRYVFAPHPAYILRQPMLVQHGQESLKIAAGIEKIIQPEYIKWGDALSLLDQT